MRCVTKTREDWRFGAAGEGCAFQSDALPDAFILNVAMLSECGVHAFCVKMTLSSARTRKWFVKPVIPTASARRRTCTTPPVNRAFLIRRKCSPGGWLIHKPAERIHVSGIGGGVDRTTFEFAFRDDLRHAHRVPCQYLQLQHLRSGHRLPAHFAHLRHEACACETPYIPDPRHPHWSHPEPMDGARRRLPRMDV